MSVIQQDDDLRRRQATRNRITAIVLGLVALAFYAGFILEHVWK